MTLYDISIALRVGTPEWPGDPPYGCTWTARRAGGSSVNLSCITCSPHVGTHADAPLHVEDAWSAAGDLPLAPFVGPATVADVRGRVEPIEIDHLPPTSEILGGRLLLRTGRTIAGGEFPDAWPVLSEPCLQALLDGGLQLLGVDAPSVDARQSQALEIHHRLFENGAYILENLDLRDVLPGRYELLAAPLKLDGLDAAPVRAVLRPLVPR